MSNISFFCEDIDYEVANSTTTKQWISSIIQQEGFTIDTLNYIFCSDEYLLKINQEYLQHDTYTDIITFDQSEEEDIIVGDIFISIDRIRDNSKTFNVSEYDELCRVLIHGVLHLMGQGDKTEEEKSIMRKREEACLSLR